MGQDALIGERGALRRMLDRGTLVSMVLWGPPGVGKTTLARLMADQVDAPFSTLSAVMSGVADVRAVIARAREWIDRGGRATVLFLDEIHRFNKAQQDALLPQVEDGTLTLIGATTENPYFEVNSALLSRLRVFRLEPLSDEELGVLVDRALVDARGLAGGRAVCRRPGSTWWPSAPVTPGRRSTCWRRRLAWRVRCWTAHPGQRRAMSRRRVGFRQPGAGRGGGAAADPGLRPGRRRPLRHGQRVHQEHARQ